MLEFLFSRKTLGFILQDCKEAVALVYSKTLENPVHCGISKVGDSINLHCVEVCKLVDHISGSSFSIYLSWVQTSLSLTLYPSENFGLVNEWNVTGMKCEWNQCRLVKLVLVVQWLKLFHQKDVGFNPSTWGRSWSVCVLLHFKAKGKWAEVLDCVLFYTIFCILQYFNVNMFNSENLP